MHFKGAIRPCRQLGLCELSNGTLRLRPEISDFLYMGDCSMMKLWNDEAGFIVSAELVLIATILVLGMIVGLVSVRDQVVQELGDVALAFGRFNQSYSFSAITGHTSSTSGGVFEDTGDVCDTGGDPLDLPAVCISVQETGYTSETP
jgi:hypothetical protein